MLKLINLETTHCWWSCYVGSCQFHTGTGPGKSISREFLLVGTRPASAPFSNVHQGTTENLVNNTATADGRAQWQIIAGLSRYKIPHLPGGNDDGTRVCLPATKRSRFGKSNRVGWSLALHWVGESRSCQQSERKLVLIWCVRCGEEAVLSLWKLCGYAARAGAFVHGTGGRCKTCVMAYRFY